MLSALFISPTLPLVWDSGVWSAALLHAMIVIEVEASWFSRNVFCKLVKVFGDRLIAISTGCLLLFFAIDEQHSGDPGQQQPGGSNCWMRFMRDSILRHLHLYSDGMQDHQRSRLFPCAVSIFVDTSYNLLSYCLVPFHQVQKTSWSISIRKN